MILMLFSIVRVFLVVINFPDVFILNWFIIHSYFHCVYQECGYHWYWNPRKTYLPSSILCTLFIIGEEC